MQKGVPEYLIWVELVAQRIEIAPPRIHGCELVRIEIQRLGLVRPAVVAHQQVLEEAEEML